MRIRANDFADEIRITIVSKNPDRVQRVRTHLMEFLNHFTQDVKREEELGNVKLPTTIESTYKGLQFDVAEVKIKDTNDDGATERTS